jgi:hypothetical protein
LWYKIDKGRKNPMKQFYVDWRNDEVWSAVWGVVTPDEYPPNRGWRAKPHSDGSITFLIGRPGKQGTASIQKLHRDFLNPYYPTHIDVALYVEDPKTVHEYIGRNEASLLDPIYRELPIYGGWGQQVVAWIQQLLDRESIQ